MMLQRSVVRHFYRRHVFLAETKMRGTTERICWIRDSFMCLTSRASLSACWDILLFGWLLMRECVTYVDSNRKDVTVVLIGHLIFDCQLCWHGSEGLVCSWRSMFPINRVRNLLWTELRSNHVLHIWHCVADIVNKRTVVSTQHQNTTCRCWMLSLRSFPLSARARFSCGNRCLHTRVGLFMFVWRACFAKHILQTGNAKFANTLI